MAAQIVWRADENFTINNLNGSGLGFYGNAGFGSSVDVGSYQDCTFITSSAGTTQGEQITNIKWTHANSGSINGAASVLLTQIPNYLATVNARFSYDSAVKVQNAKLRIYDRVSINNDPSGVLCKVAEIIHPDTVQNNNGSGSSAWSTPAGSSVILSLTSSPGRSGLYINGTQTSDTIHDFYFAISASPNSIGSKTFAAYLSLEYL